MSLAEEKAEVQSLLIELIKKDHITQDKKAFSALQELKTDVENEFFTVVVLGEFKRGKSTFINNLSNITTELITLTFFILIFRKYIIPDFYDFKKNKKSYIKKCFSYWIIGLVIMVISNIIINIFIGISTIHFVHIIFFIFWNIFIIFYVHFF